MKRWISFFLAVLFCAAGFAGCSCSHEWAPATCIAPKTCILCNQTDGQALGHTWQDATCDSPRICSICGAADGQALGHTWQDADCLNPKTCKTCGITDGQIPGHLEDLSQLTMINFLDATCEGTITCRNCGVTLSSGSQPLPRLHDGQHFLCSPQDFFARYRHVLRANTVMDASMITGDSGVYICQSQVDPQKDPDTDFVCQLIFLDGDRILTDQDSVTQFDGLRISLGTNASFLEALFSDMTVSSIAAVLSACDPAAPSALDPQTESALFDAGSYRAGGLVYSLDADDNNYLSLTVRIDTGE